MIAGQKQRFDTDAIAQRNPIEDVIAQHVPLKRNGREYVAPCPFHSEKTPSFTVIPAPADKSGKGFYHCFGCGAHGDQFKFLMMLLGVPFPEACEILGGTREAPAGKMISPRTLEPAHDPYCD